jgi:Transglycosylase SLT domain
MQQPAPKASPSAKIAASAKSISGTTGRNLIPEKFRGTPVEQELNNIAAKYGVSPQALAAVAKVESEWNPNASNRKYHGLFQLGTAEGYHPGMSPPEQVEAYGRYLESRHFADKLKAAGIDITKMSPSQQAAILQGFQFSPEKTAWMRNFGMPSTPRGAPQARSLGDTSVNAMQRYFERQMGGSDSTSAAATAGPPGVRWDYFQKQHLSPRQVPTTQIDTPFGKTRVASAAAQDYKDLFNDLAGAGAPIHSLSGIYIRKKRWGPGYSSHSYGSAIDIDNKRNFSPEMKRWVESHSQFWQDTLKKHHMLWGHSIVPRDGSGPDDPHIEWGGPGSAVPKPQKQSSAIHNNIYLDGRKIAQNVTKHQVRAAKMPTQSARLADRWTTYPHVV